MLYAGAGCGCIKEQEDYAQMILTMTEDSFFVQLDMALEYERRHDLSNALRLFASILRRSPECLDAHLGIGRCALMLGWLDQAYEHFTAVLIRDHYHREALWGRANVLMHSGQEEKACKEVQKVLELDMPPTILRVDCAALLHEFGYIAEAKEALQGYPETLHDRDYWIEWCFGRLALEAELPMDFADKLEKVVSGEPEDALGLVLLAAYVKRSSWRTHANEAEANQEAISLLERALEREPTLVYRATYLSCLEKPLDVVCEKLGLVRED